MPFHHGQLNHRHFVCISFTYTTFHLRVVYACCVFRHTIYPKVFHTIRSTPSISLNYEIDANSIAIAQMHVCSHDKLLQ